MLPHVHPFILACSYLSKFLFPKAPNHCTATTSRPRPHLHGETNFYVQQQPGLVSCIKKHLCAQAMTFDSAPDLSRFDVSGYLSCSSLEERIGAGKRHATGRRTEQSSILGSVADFLLNPWQNDMICLFLACVGSH